MLPMAIREITSFAMGVGIVGIVVILIVVTAGMVSTTWVQFIKGGLLVVFCLGLTIMILHNGLKAEPAGPAQKLTVKTDAKGNEVRLVNGIPQGHGKGEAGVAGWHTIVALPDGQQSTGPLNWIQYLTTFQKSQILLQEKPPEVKKLAGGGTETTYASAAPVSGSDVLLPGKYPLFKGVRSDNFFEKLDFIFDGSRCFAAPHRCPTF